MSNNETDYNLLKIFIKVATLGSFTKASKVLNQPKSRVSRAIARLEGQLNVQLFRRTTRKTTLTSSGAEFLKNISPLLESIDSELTRINDTQEEMSGKIKITASETTAQTLLPQIIFEFNTKYPKVKFETLITNEFVDLNKEDIDIAFRAGKLMDSALIQRKFIEVKFILVCSTNYAEKFGIPTKLEDLNNHKLLLSPLEKKFSDIMKASSPILLTTSFPMLLKMALSDNGITILPDFFCKEQIDKKLLIRIIPSWESSAENLHILYPPSQNISKRVRAFVQEVKDFSKNFN